MERSANEIMQDAIVAAVLDAVAAWKVASGGLPNALARDLGTVHANTTLGDLPKEVQAALRDATRGAFNRLLREGYTVAKGGPPPRAPRPDGPRPDGPRKDGPRGPRSGGKPPIVETRGRPRPGAGTKPPGGKPPGRPR